MRKPLSEKKAFVKLGRIKADFRQSIREGYEHKAKSCATCETPGACCLDAHFVNVHITPLEAAAIVGVIDQVSEPKRARLYLRIEEAVERYSLSANGDTLAMTYACPLFETGVGCVVHDVAKPLSCIHHACYENREDVPPDSTLEERELEVDRLNEKTYLRPTRWLPLPLAILSNRY